MRFIKKVNLVLIFIICIICTISVISSLIIHIIQLYGGYVPDMAFWYILFFPIVVLPGWIMTIITTIRAKSYDRKYLLSFWPAIKNAPMPLPLLIYVFWGYVPIYIFLVGKYSGYRGIMSCVLMAFYYLPLVTFISFIKNNIGNK